MTDHHVVKRLNDLESRMAFQDDLIERLNEVVARQDREILELKNRLKDLQLRIRELAAAPADGAPPGHEIPPHY